MVTINGIQFQVIKGTYKVNPTPMRSTARAVNGKPTRTETGYCGITYEMQLLCTYAQLIALRKWNKESTPPKNLHTFIDQEGILFSPNTGTNTPTAIYSTGVYFDELRFDAESGKWDKDGIYYADVAFTVNDNTVPVPDLIDSN
ncbi:MAG: hypothetical protein HZB51_34145 [Chloroflexi bacterium]|nr:hypothetical protein [Chloroflexota bacterium]